MMGVLCIEQSYVLSSLVEAVNVAVLFKIHFIRMKASFCLGAPFMLYMERSSIYRVEVSYYFL